MKNLIISLCCIVISFSSFSQSWKKELKADGDMNQAAINAIIDFSNSSYWFKRDNIFDVHIEEDSDILKISITGADNKALIFPSDTLGILPNETCPTNYRIVDGKLFYWHDKNSVLTQEIMTVLKDFDHLVMAYGYDDDNPDFKGVVIVTNDGRVGVKYYICRNNLLKYKKRPINSLYRYYKEPKLKCK